MRFSVVQPLLTEAIAAGAFVLLATGREIPRWLTLVLILGLSVALTVPGEWRTKRTLSFVWGLGICVLLVVGVLSFGSDWSVLGLVTCSLGIQLLILATRPRSVLRAGIMAQPVLILACMHLGLASVVHNSLIPGVMGLIGLGWMGTRTVLSRRRVAT